VDVLYRSLFRSQNQSVSAAVQGVFSVRIYRFFATLVFGAHFVDLE